MHLNIKSDEAHRLATELARLTGESLTHAVTTALRAQLKRELLRAGRGGSIAERLMRIGRRYSALPNSETSEPDDVVDYDENGLPR